jgi:hypothetical protein
VSAPDSSDGKPSERCAGIDIGKVRSKATVQVQGGTRWKTRREVRTFERTTPGLLALREWLVSEQVTFGRDGVTGVFWKLIYYLLEDVVEGWQTPWPEPPVHDKVAEYGRTAGRASRRAAHRRWRQCYIASRYKVTYLLDN